MRSMVSRTRMLGFWTVARFLGAATIWIATDSAARAQSMDAETVEAWLRAEWAEAAEAQPPPGIVFEYAVEVSEVPSESALRELRDTVRGRPDHPGRQDLEIYERRLANGPDRTVYKVWFGSADRWRLSQSMEYTQGGPSYWDTARAGPLVWGMSAQQLTLIDTEHEAEANRRFVERGTEAMQSAWISLIYGNLAFGWFRESVPTLKSMKDGEWIAQALNSAGVIGEWRGRWDAGAERGFVTSVALVGRTSGELSSVSEWRFEGWSYDEVLGAWVATRVARQLDHRPQRSTAYLGASVVSDEAVRRVTAIPDVAGEDMVRGVVTVSKVNDLRAKRDEVQWLDESREIQHTEPAGVNPRATNALRWIGWLTLAMLSCALLWVRFGRKGVS